MVHLLKSLGDTKFPYIFALLQGHSYDRMGLGALQVSSWWELCPAKMSLQCLGFCRSKRGFGSWGFATPGKNACGLSQSVKRTHPAPSHWYSGKYPGWLGMFYCEMAQVSSWCSPGIPVQVNNIILLDGFPGSSFGLELKTFHIVLFDYFSKLFLIFHVLNWTTLFQIYHQNIHQVCKCQAFHWKIEIKTYRQLELMNAKICFNMTF